MEDEDDDEGGNMGTVRYPCMPSLVALQQMRNRLHMAYLGKRLMKWTSMATGREMRRVAVDLSLKYQGYSEHVKECYIMLARSRFYYTDLNKIVLENHPKSACLTVKTTSRSVAGCKITTYEIEDDETDPYVHLGIEKCCETITETKRLWRELLTKLINILNLRTAFIDIDAANKAALKKENVLSKIVIPRTVATIRYILTELEEMERENFFRLKKVMKIKYRNKEKNHEHKEIVDTCPICLKILAEIREAERESKRVICITCLKPFIPLERTDKEILDDRQKIEELKEKLREVAVLTKSTEGNAMITASMEDFLLKSDDVRQKLEYQIKKEEDKLNISNNIPLDKLCKKCRNKLVEGELFDKHIPEVHEVTEVKPKLNVKLDIIEPEKLEDESTLTVRTEKTIQEVPYENLYDHLRPDENYEHIFNHPPPPPELGIFETEIKEITKIVRTKNEDGTIKEERKVLRIKKETRTPLYKNENDQSALQKPEEVPKLEYKTINNQ